jgi:hypothetical protein
MEGGGDPISWISSVVDLLDLPLYDLRLPNGEEPETITVRELAALGLVNVDSEPRLDPGPGWTTRKERLEQEQRRRSRGTAR